MVVREAEYRPVLEVLNQFHSVLGVRLTFSVVQISDSEDWGTADSLRSLRSKIRVSFCVKIILWALKERDSDEGGGGCLGLCELKGASHSPVGIGYMPRPLLQHQHSDILVVSCDLVTTVPLRLLTEFHSCHQSTLTCLLTHPPAPPDDAQRKTHAPAGEVHRYSSLCTRDTCHVFTTERDIVGLSSNHQLVYFSAQADLEDCLTLSRSLMKR